MSKSSGLSKNYKNSKKQPVIRKYLRSFGLVAAVIGLLAGQAYHPFAHSYATGGALAQNCFNSPGSCGYPDPAYNNVGVSDCGALPTFSFSDLPAGTFWSGSGNLLEITSDNVTISGMNFGDVHIFVSDVNNFTLDNSCIDVNGGADEGTSAIGIEAGSTNVTIENSTITGMNDTTEALGSIVDNDGTNTVIDNDYMDNAGGGAPGNGGGTATVENSYELVNSVPAGEHDEDIYFSDSTIQLYHDVLFNKENQTAAVFGDTGGGGGGACDNTLTAINNIMAGGDYVMYPCGNASSVGTSAVDIENNRFGRCGDGVDVAPNGDAGVCANGPDAHGYYPFGGDFGLIADFFTGAGQTWCGNYWDDSPGSYIDESGNPGTACSAGSAPTVNITDPSSGATVNGTVSLAADAAATSSNATVSTVQFEVDGSTVGTANASPFNFNLDTTSLSNGTHTLAALVTDSNGDIDTTSESITVDNTGSGSSSGSSGSGSVPKTPDTGLALVAAHPITTLVTTSISAYIIFVIYRRLRLTKQ